MVIGWAEAEETVVIGEIAMIEEVIEDSQAEVAAVTMIGRNRDGHHNVRKEEAAATVSEEEEVVEARRPNRTGAESQHLAVLEVFLVVVAAVAS